MKRFTCVTLIIVIAFIVTGCTREQGNQKNSFQIIYSDSYSASIISNEQSNLVDPRGICFHEEKIYVCDYAQNAVVVLDEYGHFISIFGNLGSAPSEFIGPTGITINNGKIFVIDSGNNRIQVFTLSFEFIDSFTLPQYTQVAFCDIAVDLNGNIYVSNDAVIGSEAILLCIQPNGDSVELAENFFGTLSNGEQVYAIESLEFSETSQSFILQSGKNRVFSLNGADRPKLIFQLPDKYSPAGVVEENGGDFTILSAGSCTLDRITSNGKYEITLYENVDNFHEMPNKLYLATNGKDTYYINNPVEGGIIIVSKNTEAE